MIPGWPVALTVAGSDSGGGAGIEADLKAFAAFGVWGTAALTAVTAQNHRGVLASVVMDPEMVTAQMEAVAEMAPVGAWKTGMLGHAAVIDAVAAAAERLTLGPLVVDPVQAASRGGSLLEEGAVPVLAERLLPLCSVFTPNLPEAEAFLGARITGRADMHDAAAALGRMGPRCVILKGGHLEGPDAPDLVWTRSGITWLEGPRLPAAHSHGTGCTLSAALAAGLARGVPALDACRAARQYVRHALAALVPTDSSGVHQAGSPVNPPENGR